MLWADDVRAFLGDAGEEVRGCIASVGLAPLRVVFGDCEGVCAFDAGAVVLSRTVLGGDGRASLPTSRHVPPISTPRRAAGAILEAHYRWALALHTQQNVGGDWVWCGWAADRSAAALPRWGLAEASFADALATGDIATAPRRGVAVMAAWRSMGVDVDTRVVEIVRDGVYPSPAEWLEVVRRLVDPVTGPGAGLSVVVPRPQECAPPVELAAWSWRHVAPSAGSPAAFLDGGETVAIADPWFVSSSSGAALAVAAGKAGQVRAKAAGPVGRWDLAGVQTEQGVVGGRGVVLLFEATGTLHLLTEDAVVGPCATLARGTVEPFTVTAQWRVGGERLVVPVRKTDARADGLLRLARLHDSLCGVVERPWEWLVRNDRLFVRTCDDQGRAVELRWRRVP